MSHEDGNPAVDEFDSANYFRGISVERSILTEHFMAYSADRPQPPPPDAETGQQDSMRNELQSN